MSTGHYHAYSVKHGSCGHQHKTTATAKKCADSFNKHIFKKSCGHERGDRHVVDR